MSAIKAAPKATERWQRQGRTKTKRSLTTLFILIIYHTKPSMALPDIIKIGKLQIAYALQDIVVYRVVVHHQH